ncbi:MAG: NUDIX hydrolase [Desulfuromonadales bacterium]
MTTRKTRKTVFAGHVLDVGIETHAMPDGRSAAFEIIRHPGGAAVLPVFDDGRVLLIRQFRPAIGQMIYEIPAGRLEDEESAPECASRELREETGYLAGELLPLGSCWSTVGFTDEKIHLFLARKLRKTEQSLEPDEVIELCPMSLDTALRKIDQEEILDSKTQLALCFYHRRCRKEYR